MLRSLVQNAKAHPLRLLAVGAIVLAVLVAFAWDRGLLSPHALTPPRFIDTFEAVNGVHPSFRRNHAKGVCVSGTFESNGRAARLSKAIVFRPGRIPVVGRFAFAGGDPYVPDDVTTVRSLAVRFALPNGEQWRTAMLNIPVFPFHTPALFQEQLLAMRPDPRTGKPDPAAMPALLVRHPDAARALAIVKAQPFSSGFDDSAYHGLNAFVLVSSSGSRSPVRWSMVRRPSPFTEAGPGPGAVARGLVAARGPRARAPAGWLA